MLVSKGKNKLILDNSVVIEMAGCLSSSMCLALKFVKMGS